MTRLHRRRDDQAEQGFTLIELMVVVLIIAILMAIAIPSFMSAQARAAEKKAQLALRNSLTSARTIATDLGNYAFQVGSVDSPLDASAMAAADHAYAFTDDPLAADADTVAIMVDEDPAYPGMPNTRIHMYTGSKPGRWFGLTSTTRGRVTYCQGTSMAAVDDPAECNDLKW